MTDSGVFAMDTIFDDVCALVTAAFVLTLVPGFGQPVTLRIPLRKPFVGSLESPGAITSDLRELPSN